jgi:hypothetical protein
MPIKAANKSKYPKDWKAISNRIRFERAQGQCECQGECGLHKTTPGPRRCTEKHGESAKWANGKVILTVAHLNHTEEDCRDENLKAMCQRCHLRYDTKHHSANAAATREAKKGPLLL